MAAEESGGVVVLETNTPAVVALDKSLLVVDGGKTGCIEVKQDVSESLASVTTGELASDNPVVDGQTDSVVVGGESDCVKIEKDVGENLAPVTPAGHASDTPPVVDGETHSVLVNGESDCVEIEKDVGESLAPVSPAGLASPTSPPLTPTSPIVQKSRKSSVERLLETSLNTSNDEHCNNSSSGERKSSTASCGSSVGSSESGGDGSSESGSGRGRRTSLYKQRNIEAPSVHKGNSILERTESLFDNYQRDMSVHEARPLVNVNEDSEVSPTARPTEEEEENAQSKLDAARKETEKELAEVKRQYQQRLIDEEKLKREERKKKMEAEKEEKAKSVQLYEEEEEDVFPENEEARPSSPKSSVSSSDSLDERTGETKRRTSVYEQRQIDAPTSKKGNVVASRTQNLFRQYSKDLLGDEEEKQSKASEKESELQNVKMQYQERLIQEEKEKADQRARKRSELENEELKKTNMSSQMNRYLAVTKGESVTRSSDEDEVDESLYVDERGVRIERSGGKIEIVKSSDSISSIKNKFGGSVKASNERKQPVKDAVDSAVINSARNIFKQGELKKADNMSKVRPTKKVMDPKQIMEMRKQATYGNDEEEIPRDNIVKKTTIEDVDGSIKRQALDMYKTLEKKPDGNSELIKPKTKLLSDLEAKSTMEGLRSISSSNSEASDVANDTGVEVDLNVDTVSGYESSAAPCSPSSTYSEGYLSDNNNKEVNKEGIALPL